MITNIKQLVDNDQHEFVCSSTMKFSHIKYGCKIRCKWSSEFCSIKLLERKDVRSTGGVKEQELHVSLDYFVRPTVSSAHRHVAQPLVAVD